MLGKEIYVRRRNYRYTIQSISRIKSVHYMQVTDYRMIHNGVEPDDQGNGTNVICLSFIFNPILLREIYYS